MSVKRFKFVSPGIFLNEIDNSQLPREPRPTGPLVIGRTLRGPGMRPVRVESFAEFVEIFGEPQAGAESDDPWRNNDVLSPTYASYAAQAWLKNSATCTVIRLMGKEHQDKSSGGEAGWKTSENLGTSTDNADGGGAFGLFVFDGQGFSGSYAAVTHVTGALAAVWYVDSGSMALVGLDGSSGSILVDGSNFSTPASHPLSGCAGAVESDSNGNFTAVIAQGAAASTKKFITFNLSPGHKNDIRKVFNTSPTKTNNTITDTTEIYWLGETYGNVIDMHVSGTAHANADKNDKYGTTNSNFSKTIRNIEAGGTTSGAPKYVGVIAGLGPQDSSTANLQHGHRQIPYVQAKDANGNPQTGWFFSQTLEGGGDPTNYFDYSTSTQKLFKFHALDHGEWAQTNLKVSITNIKYTKDEWYKWGTFDVLIRRISDTDKSPVVLERFSQCTLDPDSPNYIARKIGTQYVNFDTSDRLLELQGTYPNRSKYIRVQMNPDANSNAEYLPFGVYGPIKYLDVNLAAATAGDDGHDDGTQTFDSTGRMFRGASGSYKIFSHDLDNHPRKDGQHAIVSGTTGKNMRFMYPSVPLRLSASQEGLGSVKQAFFGAWTGQSKTNATFNQDIKDLVKSKGLGHDQFSPAEYTEYMWSFTLDEVISGSSGDYTWVSSSRTQGTALTAATGASYKDILDKDIDSFTTLLAGGSDGFNITEKNPFRQGSGGKVNGKTEKTGYAFNSIKESIDMCADPEFVDFNLISVPGVWDEGLTTHLIETIEPRGDALAVIDLNGDFQPIDESTAVSYGNVTTTVDNLKGRGLNSSYACTYYPWVQIRDTITGKWVFMPPSVAALGAFSYTDRVRAPWFAPAGFNRGGLSSGVAGLPVVNVTERLTARQRDKLYDANINPIASFPNEGIVIFGQKTLQITRSALDRINVRRLMLYVKKGISAISSDILFEQNVQETWDRFIGRANPFLQDVKARFGLTDFKLILDKTTTTDDLIDRNVLYAKVFLKPARAIEFIAVDFIITNTGAAFED